MDFIRDNKAMAYCLILENHVDIEAGKVAYLLCAPHRSFYSAVNAVVFK